MSTTTTMLPCLEALRAGLHAYVDTAFDDAIKRMLASDTSINGSFKSPTFEDGHDHRNKNGQNLTLRGAEILYRAFDEGAGYNRAAKLLSISQGAAKNRKAMWAKLGGKSRVKSVLDIDTI